MNITIITCDKGKDYRIVVRSQVQADYIIRLAKRAGVDNICLVHPDYTIDWLRRKDLKGYLEQVTIHE